MGLFGKSEAELKKWNEELQKRQFDLDNLESSLKLDRLNAEREKKLLVEEKSRLEAEQKAFREEVKQTREEIAAEKAEIEKRRLELAKLEAEAKAGFVEKQREAFKEVIEKRLAELNQHHEDLIRAEEQLAERYKDLHTKEAEIAKRELALIEREQKADAGFADKLKALADEANRQYRANQAEAERLKKWGDDLSKEKQQFEVEKAALIEREHRLIVAEQKRDTGFAEERVALDAELRDKRAQAEAEIEKHRIERLNRIEQEMSDLKRVRLEEIARAENVERERIRAEIASERESWKKCKENEQKLLEAERIELERLRGAVHALQNEQERRQIELEKTEKNLQLKEERLERQWQKRSEQLEDEIEKRLKEERKSLYAEKQSLEEENARLRESLRVQIELVSAFDQLKQQLGDRDPAEVLREINSKTDELKRLREELASRPTDEMRERYQALELEAKRQKARADALALQIAENSADVAEIDDLRRKASILEAENKSLKQKVCIFEGAANEACAELERLRAAYARPAEVSARYKEIEMPYITADKIRQPKKKDAIDEITWLTGIGKACDSYGLHFHPRILKAFHTSLKTAEWSPITILAGVSGTGKSELPRLYAHFGGLMFIPLSVQPNWDSQESMLGFFNSIDNKFDAQPLLRFLAQSQKKWIDKTDDNEGYPGLQDAVCIVLLDEMNLAHPELYFAEFLSKLELRRGMKGSAVPTLPVKIGAGLPPYQLPLGRNVLWTGTMNQDETTKSLSDKVLDRSIIIYFPRPTTLWRRKQLKPLDDDNRGMPLHRATWWEWLSLIPDPSNPNVKIPGSNLDDKDVEPYKAFLEKMNGFLGVVGRALGHRVWQSVEYYMANYPDVMAAKKANDKVALQQALHVAFEDQLVQKVMPKLRGIDTRGQSKVECLDKIRDQIITGINGKPFNLAEDFDLACELGYGQFIWQSANYLKDESDSEPTSKPPNQPD